MEFSLEELRTLLSCAYRKGYDEGSGDGFNGWAESPDSEEDAINEIIEGFNG